VLNKNQQHIRVGVCALLYTVIARDLSTIFQDTLSHPGPYSSSQRAAAYLVGGLEQNDHATAAKLDTRDSWHFTR
jgi:hypothetical protein